MGAIQKRQHIMRMYSHWWEGSWNYANVALAGILSTIWGLIGQYVMDISLFIGFAIVAVFIDLFFGILAALKYKEPIVSRGFYRSIEKCLVYSLVIIAFKMFQVIWAVEFLHLTYAIAGLIALSELKSISEHAEKITQVPFWSAVQQKINEAWKIIVGPKKNNKL